MTAVPARFEPSWLDDVHQMATPLEGMADLDRLLERIGDARYVLLGEASHGTAEYYTWRAAITRRLIEELGFAFVAVEGDWPDCFTINRWVKGRDGTGSVRDVLGRFARWPTWMWANREVADFANWLREHNRREGTDVGFYGLDVYSLWDSLRAVLAYLTESQPDVLDAARRAFGCFERYGEDPQAYARATAMVPASCEDDVVDLLVALRSRATGVEGEPESELDAQQNAEVVAGAERYYRTMVRADGASWNVRDCHMADTLDRLVAHHGDASRAVVWAHNTHVGDARATDMAAAGMVNVGQLVRERQPPESVVLVGFCAHKGSVVAADFWGAPMRRMAVPPAPAGTHEDVLHHALGSPSVIVFPRHGGSPWLSVPRGHRAIGVVYHPSRDRYANWVPTVMGRRYDAFLSFDDSHALSPLPARRAEGAEELETYPWAT